MSAYKTSMKARYAAFTKRAAEMKRLRTPDVAAMKSRYAANLRGPTLVKVYTQPSDPTKLAGPRKRESEPAHSDSMNLHDEKRRKTSPMTYVGMSKDAADLADTKTDKIADVFAAMSVKSVTKTPRKTRIISATFEFQTRASSKMANAIANMSPMPNNTAESRVYEFTRWDQPIVRV
ncbi:hypothetical protein KCU92_g3012, partial [Aureobasidium melanogenum]|jgi:hypothetical protein